ncbi:MAG: hypothetical protein PWP70_1768 [Moorella sp. (in: firmicutes)]|nr:hypothetical protein [Moorella sp. (in: firmicutes)]
MPAILIKEEISARIAQGRSLYYQLVLLVGPSGSGKTRILQELAGQQGYHYINVNLELSRHLLELSRRQRALHTPLLLAAIIQDQRAGIYLLDNMEILFDPALQQDPLRLLQGLARDRTIVAAWNGTLEKGHLIYAIPGHPEYRRYPAGDLTIVTTGNQIGPEPGI